MNLANPITVGLILLCAGGASVLWIGFCVFMHHRERSRPPHSCDWREADFGDFPSVKNLFHNGTDTL